jgi:hypothetical protein
MPPVMYTHHAGRLQSPWRTALQTQRVAPPWGLSEADLAMGRGRARDENHPKSTGVEEKRCGREAVGRDCSGGGAEGKRRRGGGFGVEGKRREGGRRGTARRGRRRQRVMKRKRCRLLMP